MSYNYNNSPKKKIPDHEYHLGSGYRLNHSSGDHLSEMHHPSYPSSQTNYGVVPNEFQDRGELQDIYDNANRNRDEIDRFDYLQSRPNFEANIPSNQLLSQYQSHDSFLPQSQMGQFDNTQQVYGKLQYRSTQYTQPQYDQPPYVQNYSENQNATNYSQFHISQSQGSQLQQNHMKSTQIHTSQQSSTQQTNYPHDLQSNWPKHPQSPKYPPPLPPSLAFTLPASAESFPPPPPKVPPPLPPKVLQGYTNIIRNHDEQIQGFREEFNMQSGGGIFPPVSTLPQEVISNPHLSGIVEDKRFGYHPMGPRRPPKESLSNDNSTNQIMSDENQIINPQYAPYSNSFATADAYISSLPSILQHDQNAGNRNISYPNNSNTNISYVAGTINSEHNINHQDQRIIRPFDTPDSSMNRSFTSIYNAYDTSPLISNQNSMFNTSHSSQRIQSSFVQMPNEYYVDINESPSFNTYSNFNQEFDENRNMWSQEIPVEIPIPTPVLENEEWFDDEPYQSYQSFSGEIPTSYGNIDDESHNYDLTSDDTSDVNSFLPSLMSMTTDMSLSPPKEDIPYTPAPYARIPSPFTNLMASNMLQRPIVPDLNPRSNYDSVGIQAGLNTLNKYAEETSSSISDPFYNNMVDSLEESSVDMMNVSTNSKRHSYTKPNSISGTRIVSDSKRLSLPENRHELLTLVDPETVSVKLEDEIHPSDHQSRPQYLPIRANTIGDIGEKTFNPKESIMSTNSNATDDGNFMRTLNLPSIPVASNKFSASRLSSKNYQSCSQPWALSSIANWLAQEITEDMEVAKEEIIKAIAGLFTHEIATLNSIHAERCAISIVNTFAREKYFLFDKFTNAVTLAREVRVSGVIPALTKGGCYSPYSHAIDDSSSTYRCYSSRCALTLVIKKSLPDASLVELGSSSSPLDWAAYWNFSKTYLDSLDTETIKKQYAIHELIAGEESFIHDLRTFLSVYGEAFKYQVPPLMDDQEEFWQNAFSFIPAIIECNTKYLLNPLKYRQKEEGPFMKSIADIFLSWTQVSEAPFVQYAKRYLYIDTTLRKKRENNLNFRAWLDKVGKDSRVRMPYSFYFHRVLPRLARYSLLLQTISKNTLDNDAEVGLLARAIKECDAITSCCDSSIAQVEKNIELTDIKNKILWKSSSEKVNLGLQNPSRKVIKQGDVTRRGNHRVDWIETHLILLDNYLLISKIRNGGNGSKYYITKRPIPLELLVLESCSDDPVTKSSSSKLGVGTFTSTVSTENKRHSRQFFNNPTSPTNQKLAPDSYVPGGNSLVTIIGENDNYMYPFKIKHLGLEGGTYMFYSPTAVDRENWRDAFILAKKQFNSLIFTRKTEPFRLKVVSDYAFGYDPSDVHSLPVFAPNTVVDRALHESQRAMPTMDIPRPLIRSRVNCATSFVFMDGREFTLVGLDFGIFVSAAGDSLLWSKCLDSPRVSQIDVIPEMNILLCITDKALVYYNLDEVLSSGLKQKPGKPVGLGVVGHRLSKYREVGFFSVGRMKDRVLLFYKRKEGLSSTFNVLEPVKEKGSLKKRSKIPFARVSDAGSTEYFRDVDKIYVPTECYGMNIFNSTFAIHSSKGFEIMSLDFKFPRSLPASYTSPSGGNLSIGGYTGDSLKKKVDSSKTMGMFRVTETSFILCYEEFAIFTDKYGNIMGNNVVNFISKASSVAIQHPFIFVINEEMIEIRKVDDLIGNVKQIITGKDIRLLDGKEGQLMIGLTHPTMKDRQIVLEFIRNEYVLEDNGRLD